MDEMAIIRYWYWYWYWYCIVSTNPTSSVLSKEST